jgi:3-oxoacyl-[acyl-carrier protein] reductase
VVDRARRQWRRVHALINNAAVQGPIGPLEENDWAEWTRAVQVNLLAPAALCRLVVPWMKETGGGAIVNLSGGGATGPRPNFSAYATAKAGLVRFSETLAAETEPQGIRVNCVAPGGLATDMQEEILSAGRGRAGQREYEGAQRNLKEGAARLENAAALVAHLASPDSVPITGRLLSAVWDPWRQLCRRAGELVSSDVYTLRRIVPSDRGLDWEPPS